MPNLPQGPHRRFNRALHQLHLAAGRPSLSAISQVCVYQRSAISTAMSSTVIPSWTVVDALVTALVELAPIALDRDEHIKDLHQLWMAAASHQHGDLQDEDPQDDDLDASATSPLGRAMAHADPLLTVKQVAARLGVETARVKWMLLRHELPYYQVSKRIKKVAESAVDDYLRRRDLGA
ncbi:hypothetical protein BIV57_00215 [Mangrovactinospora gilvigrisea]|uniref:Helix-turn-helix domain-containing protein n=1 Tax=Mangrovactinospora gilvigrisea TaxID=1428644 RepID=A0A1J7CCP5_9ACTN|nr:helix-turn-helix domain-containing protein [Mangrovactinospora gilvigrisea]OIV39312.1 hypothetical protein BIV57_00215 [Mangrovactinospora gilvigrisea]